MKKIKWLSEMQARNLSSPCVSQVEYGRNTFTKDYNQIIHSTFFRRLAHKTQVHTTPNSDHIRTRLTHSIETEQIGRQIARYFFRKYLNLNTKKHSPKYLIDLQNKIEDLTAASCLAHDIGHPPFGHTGTKVLNGTLNACEFDDNKQVVRILLNEYLYQNGNPSAAFVCSVLKKHSTQKNAYSDDQSKLNEILEVCGLKNLRHPLSYFMEAADDIAYITSDIYDYLENINDADKIQNFATNVKEYLKNMPLIENNYEVNSKSSMIKKFNNMTRDLKQESIQIFCSYILRALLLNVFKAIDKIMSDFNTMNKLPKQMNNFFERDGMKKGNNEIEDNLIYWKDPEQWGECFYNFKKNIYNNSILTHDGIGIRDITAQNILPNIINELSKITVEKDYKKLPIYHLLPEDFKLALISSSNNEIAGSQSRIVLDFVSGMTDRYAIRFWEKIKQPSKIYKYVA